MKQEFFLNFCALLFCCCFFQGSFVQRLKVYQNKETAQQTLTKKREILVKLELAGKQDKIPAAQEEVKEVCGLFSFIRVFIPVLGLIFS